MGFGDFLKAGASALGVDTDDIGGFLDKAEGVLGGSGDTGDLFDAAAEQFGGGDIGGFFDKAKGALGGDGDAGDLFGAAVKQFGIDADDVTSAVSQGSGGFGNIVGNLLGDGDAASAAGKAVGGFGALFGGDGGEIATAVSEYLPTSVTQAFSEAADLPFVQDAANGNWADMAGSVPGLDGALGSFGLSTKDIAQHIEGVAAQSIDGGSAWSFGNMLADQGAGFLNQVAAPVDSGSVWTSLPGLAERAGVELPHWATDLQADDVLRPGGQFLQDGGFAPTQVTSGADLYAAPDDVRSDVATTPAVTDDTIGESQVDMATEPGGAAVDPSRATTQSADEFVARDEFSSDVDAAPADQAMTAAPPEVEPGIEEAPAAPAPEQFAAANDLEGGLDDLGDDVFG